MDYGNKINPREVSFTWKEYLDIMAKLQDLEDEVKELTQENQTLREQLDTSGYANV